MISNDTITMHRQQIIKQLFDLCGNYEMAKDVFQDACIKAYESENLYNDGGLFTIAKNILIDKSRYRKVRRKINMRLVDGYDTKYEDDIERIEYLNSFEENLKTFVKVLNDLSPRKRMIIKERLKGKSFKEISEKHNLKMNTILPYFHRGMIDIKEIIYGNAN